MEASAARRPPHSGPRVPARLLRLASDERLVEHVRSGSEPAFEAVFDRHPAASSRSAGTCSDRPRRPRTRSSTRSWPRTAASSARAARSSCVPGCTRSRATAACRCCAPGARQPVDDLDELPTENLSAEVQRRQDLRDLLLDVGGLPEDQRAALVLAEVGGVSHDEIAQVLGVQREKVKALVFQARSSLIASRDARDDAVRRDPRAARRAARRRAAAQLAAPPPQGLRRLPRVPRRRCRTSARCSRWRCRSCRRSRSSTA